MQEDIVNDERKLELNFKYTQNKEDLPSSVQESVSCIREAQYFFSETTLPDRKRRTC